LTEFSSIVKPQDISYELILSFLFLFCLMGMPCKSNSIFTKLVLSMETYLDCYFHILFSQSRHYDILIISDHFIQSKLFSSDRTTCVKSWTWFLFQGLIKMVGSTQSPVPAGGLGATFHLLLQVIPRSRPVGEGNRDLSEI